MFCPYCGKRLENGAFCDCPEAQKELTREAETMLSEEQINRDEPIDMSSDSEIPGTFFNNAKDLLASGSKKAREAAEAGIEKVKQASVDGTVNIKKLKVKPILISALALFALLLVATSILQPKPGTSKQGGEPAAKQLSHCDVCDGLGSTCTNCRGGICPDCNGAGYYNKLDGYKNGQPVYRGPYDCQTCNGSGKCPVCGGKKDCTACNGSGYKLKYTGEDYCKTCLGSGICSKCLGEGQCRQCSGSGIVPQYNRQPKECTYCHGTGACSANCNNGYCAKCNGTGKA